MSRLAGAAGTALLVLGAVSLVGCASGAAKPAAEPRPAATRPAPAVQPEPPAPEPAPQPPATEPEEVTGAYGPMTVVIDDPEVVETTPPTLAEAARRARESRAEDSTEPIAVITDANLPDFATGELSIAEEKSGAAAPAATEQETPDAEAEEERGEEYWRERVRGARIRWRDLVEEIERLEGEVAKLRERFYAEDDGFYRDSQIKPAWDRALDRLAETQDEVVRAQENLETILQEGRLAGALPGWLREGVEYEPAPAEPDEGPGIHEATEPQVIDEDGGEIRP